VFAAVLIFVQQWGYLPNQRVFSVPRTVSGRRGVGLDGLEMSIESAAELALEVSVPLVHLAVFLNRSHMYGGLGKT
jgi:hypothetical protein